MTDTLTRANSKVVVSIRTIFMGSGEYFNSQYKVVCVTFVRNTNYKGRNVTHWNIFNIYVYIYIYMAVYYDQSKHTVNSMNNLADT